MCLAVGMQPQHIKPCTQFVGSVQRCRQTDLPSILYTVLLSVLLLLFDYIKKLAEFNK